MIDRTALKRLSLTAAVVSVVAAGLSFALRGPALAGGIGLGFVLGMAPFLSWAWIAARGFQKGSSRVLAVLLLLGKLALYSGALYLLVTREVVSPLGVMIGVTLVVFTFAVGALLMGDARAKGAQP